MVSSRVKSGGIASQFSAARRLWRRAKTVQEKTEALSRLRQIAKKGDTEHWMFLGLLLFWDAGDLRDIKEGVRWIQRAAEQGDVAAQYMLASEFATGDHVERSPLRAAKWYRAAARAGNAEAEYNLGMMYWERDGLRRDVGKAHRLWLSAATKGEPLAVSLLADAYRVGAMGFAADPDKARYWKQRLAAAWKGRRPRRAGARSRRAGVK